MPRGRWKKNLENLAIEAYAVLISRKKPSRRLTKEQLIAYFAIPDVALHFLKLCLDYDDSADLRALRAGLRYVVQARGFVSVAKAAGFSRISLYRMLSKKGNPRLKNLLALFKALGLRFWLVDDDFIRTRTRLVRPKDAKPDFVHTSTGRRIKPERIDY